MGDSYSTLFLFLIIQHISIRVHCILFLNIVWLSIPISVTVDANIRRPAPLLSTVHIFDLAILYVNYKSSVGKDGTEKMTFSVIIGNASPSCRLNAIPKKITFEPDSSYMLSTKWPVWKIHFSLKHLFYNIFIKSILPILCAVVQINLIFDVQDWKRIEKIKYNHIYYSRNK